MKKFYTRPVIFIYCLGLLAGCSKDFLKSYENRLAGTWELYDVDKRGFGGNTGNLPFRDGTFTFQESGTMLYVNGAGNSYNGSWDLDRDWVRGQCVTDDNGYTNCNDREVKTMSLTAIDFTTQVVITEHFDEINFTSTNRFRAYIYSGAHTYVFYFRRQ